ncbi:MAG TPA: hypothetical protein PKA05_17960 [Roseiflexaceae bacterium]|nr:hypothetical protein [Roseiflexaceae bacterium]
MYLETLPIGEALGHILRHNIAAADGRKALPKGRLLADADLAVLAELNIAQVRVAILEPGDVHEDEAARRLGIAVAGRGIVAGKATHSRVNLLAAGAGILDINTEALLGINEIDGLTIATLVRHTPVRERMRVATIKIIPFAVPEGLLAAAEAIGRTAAELCEGYPPSGTARQLLPGSAANNPVPATPIAAPGNR